MIIFHETPLQNHNRQSQPNKDKNMVTYVSICEYFTNISWNNIQKNTVTEEEVEDPVDRKQRKSLGKK